MDRQALAAIAPTVRAQLHIDHTQFGWLVAAFAMAYLVGAPAAGTIIDRLGARKGFAIAVVVWSAVAGAHALAVSFASLFVLRALLGASESPSFPAALQAVQRSLPVGRKAAALGLLFTGSSLGAIIAAPLAIGLTNRFGFRIAFLGTAVVGLLWIPFWLSVTRRAPIRPVEPTPTVVRKGRWIDVVTSGPVLRAMVVVVGSAPSVMFIMNFGSQYLVEAWHIPAGRVGGYLIFPPLLFDAGAIGFGWLASRRERSGPHSTPRGLFAIATALASLLTLVPFAPTPAAAMALCSLSACGGAGLFVISTSDMVARTSPARTSAAGGMTAAAQSLAQIIAAPIVGAVIDRGHDATSYAPAFAGVGVLVVPAGLVFLFWPSLR